MATLFFSYSHKDEDLRDRLEVHLAMLKRQGAIETWHDRRIVAGDDFAGSIDVHLAEADVILLLVSADFLASSYCYEVEMTRALEMQSAGEATVIPVILRHCDWHSAPFGHLLAAPADGKPILAWADLDAAFLDVVKQIREALPKGSETLPVVKSSDVRVSSSGPRSSNLHLTRQFTEADKDRFLDQTFTYLARFLRIHWESLSLETRISRPHFAK